MATVGIGQHFFRKSLDDYRDWKWAMPREAMQNSMDAPHSKNIDAWFEIKDGNTIFSWGNDGDSMSKEELVGKLLTLGESGKDFQGTVGGFGAAKLVLLFAHLHYEIYTGNYYVSGSGGNYTLEERDHCYPGTLTKVTLEGDVQNTLSGNLVQFLYMAQWSGTIKINGQMFETKLNKGSRRREFDWGVVYTNKTFLNRLVVRIHGIPMFYRYVDSNKRCVVVELKAGDATVLQSNRDALKSDYQRQLDSFIDELTVDKLSALRDVSPQYTHFNGKKFSNRQIKAEETMAQIVSAAYATLPTHSEDEKTETIVEDHKTAYAPPEISTRNLGTHSKLNHEFIIKNTTGMEVPAHYLPSEFSEYSMKLTKIWAQVMLALHDLFNKKAEFSVGFIFDEDNEAQFEDRDYGQVYFINPISIVKQGESNSRSMAKRWKFSPAGRWAILADALHEFVHGAIGLHYHDELYSTTLTTMFGVVLKEKQRFNRCFV